MRFWSKLFKSVRRNEEGDDTITPITTSSSSSSKNNNSKHNRTNSPSIISNNNSNSNKKIYDGGADDESQDSSNSNAGNSIDYSKLNLEDVFDFEGIEVMCREAEDLNLIEFLTQEDIISKLIDYVITFHNEIPAYLEYKLNQSSLLQESSIPLGMGGNNNNTSSPNSAAATDDELLLYEKQKEEYLRAEQVDTISGSESSNGLEMSQISNSQSTTIGDQRDYLLQKLNFKYPFIATEILISTIGQYHILPLIMINNNNNNNLNSSSPLSTNSNNQLKSNSNNDLTSTNSTSPRSTFKSNLNGEVIRRKLFSFIYQTKPLNSFQVKCFVRVIIAMMKIPHLTHLVMDYIYQENSTSLYTTTTTSTTTISGNNNNINNNNNNNINGSSGSSVNGSASGSGVNGISSTTAVATSTSSSHILQMLKHIDSSDEISELLLMCLLYEDEEIENSFSIIPSGNIIQDSFLHILNQTDESQIHKNNQVLKLKQMIIQQLCSLQCEQNYSRSVTFILTTIIQYRKPTTKKPPTIVQYILNRKQMELIIENTLKITSNSPSFVDNMNFIMNLILYISNNSQRLFILEQDSISNIDWKMVLILVIEKIKVFVQLLNDDSAREILKKDPTIIYVEQYHPLQSMLIDKKRGQLLNLDRVIECLNFNPLISFPPLGIYRLKIIELFVILFKHLESLDNIYSTNERNLSQIILDCDILEELIRLLFQYQSSLLHQMITRLLLDILEQNMEPFFESLFTKYNIVDRILKSHNLNQQLQREQRYSLAISGYLTVFGQIIGDKQLALLQENEKWLEFYQYASDRTFIEKVFRIGSVESHQSLPQGELQRLKDLEEFWANNNL